MSKQKHDNSYHPRRRLDPDKLPCPHCGETFYEWGKLSGKIEPRFSSEDITRIFIWQGAKTHARHCLTCGAVQVFTIDE